VELPELVRREPAASLRGVVNAYYGYREQTAQPMRRREGPGGDVVVILGFDTSWWIGDAVDPSDAGSRHSSYSGGLRETQVLTEHDGYSDGMQVNLAPAAARALFRVPMGSLTGRIIDLEELLGRRATRLVEQLQEQGSWAKRFDVLDATLTQWLSEAPPRSTEVSWAHARLRTSHGRVRVSWLAQELGWSRKRMAARFREEVGLTPKAVARVLRFERAVRLASVELAQRGDLGWGRLAHECGYYDQAHLIREFKAISGCTPGTFFQDPAVPAA
jgi:AraC-like DNA-binding protein